MAKENAKRLAQHYSSKGKEAELEDLKKSYKNTYGEELSF